MENVTSITFELALQVIASAGFGFEFGWEDDLVAPAGHRMVRSRLQLCPTAPLTPSADVQDCAHHDFGRGPIPCRHV